MACEQSYCHQLFTALKSATRLGSICSKVNCLLKTHKAPGEVGVRVIYSTSGHKFQPWSRYVGRVIAKSVDSLYHVCTSTQDLLSKLGCVHAYDDDKIIKLDIVDFYMRGSHRVMVDTCFNRSESNTSTRKAFDFLLSNQYVYSHDLCALYLVNLGSGMGACHSGQAADSVLHKLGEAPWSLDPVIQRKYRVRCWLRYRDDIFVVLGGCSDSRREFIRGFIDLVADVWSVKCDQVGREVEMLDVTVSLLPLNDGSGRAKFEYKPYTKPTYRPIPLSITSSHPPTVHWWPLAQVIRLYRNSSNHCDFLVARAELFQRYAEQMMSPAIINKCMQFCPQPSHNRKPCIRATKRVFSLVMDYHPLLDGNRISNVAKHTCRRYDYELTKLLGPIEFRVSWRNGGSHFFERFEGCL